MTIRPGPEVLRCVGLPADADLEPAGGATGAQWKVCVDGATYALRLSRSKKEMARQVAAMTAARSVGLPVPEVLQCASTASHEVMLCTWLPGTPIYELLPARPNDAYHFGHLMGVAQRALHQAPAPAALPAVKPPVLEDGSSPAELVGRSAVLHMDFHPYNVLVDDHGVSGIVDWVNAGAGHPLLDLARTHALLIVEPELQKFGPDVRRIVATLAEGWADGYGEAARSIPPICHAWAGAAMLAERAPRYAHDPAILDELRAWTEQWRQRAVRRPADRGPR
ncbi:phosphotransferase family protein [Thermasporomyces composti]|jgi:aminoglycoside phosphotransferase (APT) family kinase protein|uniref:Phosphotransferase family enzyme n=1 Tax=Thermasporomyces composti TaxID=696763 RepID=A0A3D9UZ55_THECX|nr:phosphotransferase [Thermasporomyces composti]REF34778.1 phosphotransferase family enzyme [Thermasporomyces composti]